MIRTSFALAVFVLGLSAELFAMTSEPTRLVLFRRGETIAGEEFLAFDEGIVDYIATLKRPTDLYSNIKYNCTSKSRLIRPSVVPYNSSSTNVQNQWVEVRVVYELKDCTQI